jgi:hypothetical protein
LDYEIETFFFDKVENEIKTSFHLSKEKNENEPFWELKSSKMKEKALPTFYAIHRNYEIFS